MDTSKIAAHLDRVENIFTLRAQKLSRIDPGLRAEIQAERKQQIEDEFVNNSEGLHKQRIAMRANIAELRAERAKVADPQAALMRTAWARSADLTPGQLALLESAKTASPGILGQMIDLAGNSPAAVAVLAHHVRERKGELEATKQYAGLHDKVLAHAEKSIDRGHVRQLAALEHRALTLELKSMSEVDGTEPAERLTIGREIEAAKVVAENG